MKVLSPTLETKNNAALTAHDRCDACGAQAQVRVQVGEFGELLFCAHHARKHAPALEGVADIIAEKSDNLES